MKTIRDTMLTDKDFDIVFFSEYLKNPTSITDRGLAGVYKGLESILLRHGYTPRLLPYDKSYVMRGKLAVWCRDYMPVHSWGNNFVRFTYTPDYLKSNKYKDHIPDSRWIIEQIGISTTDFANTHTSMYDSLIVLDGGNLVRCGNKVIMTEKVFNENRNLDSGIIRKKLEELFQAEIVFLPWDTRESFGHTDGIVRYINGNRVLLGTYGDPEHNTKDSDLRQRYMEVLETNGFVVEQLDFGGIDEDSKYRWSYVNWLQLKDLIILPSFKDTPKSNEQAHKQITELFKGTGINIEMSEATELVKNGGAFNCASWTTTQIVMDNSHNIKKERQA